jgi:hypothetical protein
MTDIYLLMLLIWFIGWWFTTGVVVPRELTLLNVAWFISLIASWPIALGEWVAEHLPE